MVETAVPAAWRTRAAAKLNLTLEVLGRRDDGYHELASVVVALDLADDVLLRRGTAADGRAVRFIDPERRPVSTLTDDESVARSWGLLAERLGVDRAAHVEVTKRIPVAAGLGGGTSDAAAFLRLACERWGLDTEAVQALAASVGSDVPVSLLGGAALMEGRGERLQPLPDPPQGRWAVLLFTPEIPTPGAKTATMFSALRPPHFADGSRTAALAQRLRAGEPPRVEDLANTFDTVADEVMTGLHEARRRMASALVHAGSECLPLLAGAGPTLFAMDREAVLQVAAWTLSTDPRPEARGLVQLAKALGRDDATRVETLG